MSLSFNLDVSGIQNLDKLSEALSNLYKNGFATDIFRLQGAFRMFEPTGELPDILPTGEYIIRDGMYINGMYVYVGSYKGYFRNLFGTNSDGYAWDGFILVARGYNLNENFGELVYDDPNLGFVFGSGVGFLAMRMPFEVNPGGSGDATAIAADSSVGLHSLDVYKNEDDITVLRGDTDIRIMTCGFQRINPSAESVPTGMDYVGNIYMGILLRYNGIGPLVEDYEVIDYEYLPDDMMQITWRANQTGHTDKTYSQGRFGIIRDLDQETSLSFIQAGDPYTLDLWLNGQKPDGTGGLFPTGDDTRAISFNYFPRRFFDIVCQSATNVGSGLSTESPFYIVGDVSLDSNDDGSIDDTCPILLGCAYPYGYFEQLIINSAFIPNAPFISMNAAIATSLARSPSWIKEDTTVAYNFSGAWAASILIPYENLEEINFETQPLSYIAVNDVTHSGSTYGEIYCFQISPLNGAAEILPFAVETGAFTTASGITLPTRWYNKATQFRTFTVEEEDASKYGITSPETGEFFPTFSPANPRSIFDPDSQEYIGFDGNYQRYGSFTNPLEPNQPQGTRSGAGYGFLGIRTGTGPIAIMFDSGDGKTTPDVLNLNYSLTTLAEGQNINNNHLNNPNSTTRKIINCGWDNDRDQWLFLTSDTNDFGVISVASNFTTDSNNIGFLDQTSNFENPPANADAGFYAPITMSNSLDGWVWLGDLDTDSNVRFGIKNADLGNSVTITETFAEGQPNEVTVTWVVYPDATTYVRRITGTTGRTARVWVDYVLFDGPDAIIANKIKDKGMKVSIEAVEWFKRQIIQTGDLNITAEEIEMWMRDQQDEYKQTLKEIERQGRIRRKKKQVSAYLEGVEDQINPDFFDTEVEDFKQDFTPTTRPPTPEESRIERKKKGGYTPEQGSYYDEVFED